MSQGLKKCDVVRCINAIGAHFLRPGRTYYVTHVVDGHVWVEGSRAPWATDRFEPINNRQREQDEQDH